MKRWVLAFDVGGSSVKGGLFNGEHMVDKWSFSSDLRDGARRIVPDIAHSADEALSRNGLQKIEVTGIGVALACPVTEAGRCGSSPKLPWEGYDAQEELRRACGIPAVIGNDATLAALGEMWQGSARDVKNIVCYTVGTGLGCGVIVGGAPVCGAHGYAGEVAKLPAHLLLNEPFVDGHEVLDDVLSATGITSMASALLNKSEASLRERAPIHSAKEVCIAWEAGDGVASRVINAFTDAFAKLIVMQCATIDPGIVVIGGGVSQAGSRLIEKLSESYQRHCGTFPTATCIVPAALGRYSGVYGAAKLAFDAASISERRATV